MRRTKIICTLGPRSSSREAIRAMIQAGMNVARLNFSHGDYDFHRTVARLVREEAEALGYPVALLQDLQGVKIRIGEVQGGEVELREGSVVEVRQGEGETTASCVYVRYEALLEDIAKGEEILLDDGNIRLEVVEEGEDKLLARVCEGGVVRSRKGVNFPQTKTSIRTFTPKDREDVKVGMAIGVDYVAVSFVKDAEDLMRIRRFLSQEGLPSFPLIAKIERREALGHIEEICEVADGVMVARGDLGVETPLEMVPIYQKQVMDAANKRGKIVIVATQMLESMREHPRPTRAEATDVANAVLDGADALMLSAETAMGRYPVEATKTMHALISAAENHLFSRIPVMYERKGIFPEAIVSGAVQTARDIQAKAIVVFTQSGFSALLLSQLRPAIPIIAMTPNGETYTRLALIWGVYPRLLPQRARIEDPGCLKEAEELLLQERWVRHGDAVVFVASSPFLGSGNVIRLHRIGDPLGRSFCA